MKNFVKFKKKNDKTEIGKREPVSEKLLGSQAEIKKRMELLYGKADFHEQIQAYRCRNKKKYIILLAVAFIVILFLTADLVTSNQGFITGAEGIVTALERPQSESSARYMLVVKDAESGKRLLEGTVSVRSENEKSNQADKVTEEELAAEQQEIEKKQAFDAKSRAVKRVLSDMTVSTQGAVLELPKALPDGTKIKFERKLGFGNIVLVLLAVFLLFFCVYKKRYGEAEREAAEARESVLCELPDFINKLVLLLEAGLVVTSAFDKILERPKEGSYFYDQLLAVQCSMKQTNSSFDREFGGFARRIGVRELMRAANIIGDNLDKGSALCEKLMAEGNLLWHERKKNVEQRGRLAETKLTFPLMILLLVLIMITIAPAMMEI